ncbi:MAG: cytidine deaminase [FCB group bacterium]|nr:cytidine deaminase [FCB group bacterium]
MKDTELIDAARKASALAKAEYSGFKVGAAILCADGEVFTGCNIESSSYSLTVCAERVALWKALSEGAEEFIRIAVVTGNEKPTAPCGACRQVLWDFAPKIEVIMAGTSAETIVRKLADIFPLPFDKKELE